MALISTDLVKTLPIDPVETATVARLRYVSDATPGIRRLRVGRGFQYRGVDDMPVRDADTLARIRSLAIPPAWTDVWICPTPNGHIQAVGRDARQRKQYRYHPRWREARDETKYARLIAFGQALPRMRRRVEQDMDAPGLSREKVLATVVRLLETTLIRVGNPEYAQRNGSYGLTTLRSRHVRINGSRLRFEFRGKGGKPHIVDVNDRRVAAIVRRCQDLPGRELFQYVDEAGARQTIDSGDVNEYLRQIAGSEFTAKDFRTWAGTVHALANLRAASGVPPTKKKVNEAVVDVASRLRNTPAICRKSYIHPAIVEAYLESELGRPRQPAPVASGVALRSEERALLALLRRRNGNGNGNGHGNGNSHGNGHSNGVCYVNGNGHRHSNGNGHANGNGAHDDAVRSDA
jgi:DNA topoisomerase-1